jgi:hypothetical protein
MSRRRVLVAALPAKVALVVLSRTVLTSVAAL